MSKIEELTKLNQYWQKIALVSLKKQLHKRFLETGTQKVRLSLLVKLQGKMKMSKVCRLLVLLVNS